MQKKQQDKQKKKQKYQAAAIQAEEEAKEEQNKLNELKKEKEDNQKYVIYDYLAIVLFVIFGMSLVINLIPKRKRRNRINNDFNM